MNKKLVSILLLTSFLAFSVPGQVLAARDFPDIKKHWAGEFISALSAAGYISGYPDGTFKPDKTVSQAEFITVLISCMGLSPTDTPTNYFNDIKKHWARASINEAVKQGILVPSEYSNVLQPDSGLKRSQAAAMLVRALGRPPDNGATSFTDKAEVEKSMYRGYIKTAYDLHLLTGYPGGEFKPFEYVTRAQMCKLILNFMEINGGAPTSAPSTAPNLVNPISGSFNAIAVGDELYDLAVTPASIKIGFTDVKIKTLSADAHNLYVNGGYSFALNTSLDGLDLIVYNKRYKVDKIMVNDNKLVIYPAGQKIADLTIGLFKYDSDYIKVYVNSTNGTNYLSDLLLLDQYTVQLNGKIYNLRQDRVTIEAGTKYYDIQRVLLSPTDNDLQLLETEAVIINTMTLDKISSIFVDNNTLDMATVRNIEFIIGGKHYFLSQTAIDAAGKFTVNNQSYEGNSVLMLVDGEQYKINHVQMYKEKFIFYCASGTPSNLVMINDVYHDASEVKILKDDIAYDMEQVLVVSRDLVRIGGKQYYLDPSFKCRLGNKIYNIDRIDFNTNLQAVIIDTSETAGSWSNQPAKYIFYVNNSKYEGGISAGVSIYAGRQWINFDRILINDPAHFSYSGSNYNLIGALVRINGNDFEVTDTSWHGYTQFFDLYMIQI